jgi:hypothetical protein
MREAVWVVSSGLVVGVGAAVGLTRIFETILFGVTPTDPTTYAAVTLLLLGTAAGACVVPIVRATSVEPVTALRN